MNLFYLQGNQIQLYKYQLFYKGPKGEDQIVYFPSNEEAEFHKNRLLKQFSADGNEAPEFVITDLDTSSVSWMDGIDVGNEQQMKKAEEIFEMGKDAYMESLESTTIEDLTNAVLMLSSAVVQHGIVKLSDLPLVLRNKINSSLLKGGQE